MHGFSNGKSLMGTPPLVLKTYFRYYQANRKWPLKTGFWVKYHYWTDFRNSNSIFQGSIEVMTENYCRWKSNSGFDGKRLLAYNLRTNKTNFKIQTAYVKVQLQWLIKIFVAKNLLPVLAEHCYLLIIRELIDKFSEFKRQMFRFDSNKKLENFVLENLLPL